MNYKRIYDELITRARCRDDVHGYTERHHVIPRCMGGTNATDNIVRLTASEHYIAHQLLVKIYQGNKSLLYAARCMCVYVEGVHLRGNKYYSWIKNRISESMMSENNPMYGMCGSKHPVYGRKHTPEEKRKISESMVGDKHHFYGKHLSDVHRLNISKSLSGRVMTDEHKEKIGAGNRGKVMSPESRAKISASKIGVSNGPHSEETKQKIRDSNTGKPGLCGSQNGMYGKKHSEETRMKMSKPRTLSYLECPHCGKVGATNNMRRYHFDNCRLKGLER